MLSEKSVMGAPHFIKFSKTVKFTSFSIFWQNAIRYGQLMCLIRKIRKSSGMKKKFSKIGQRVPILDIPNKFALARARHHT